MRSPALLDKHRQGRPDATRRESPPRDIRGASRWPGSRAPWALAVAGLAAYNWWVLVPLRPGLLRSPDEVYSNLEVAGRPYAPAMQLADLLAGVLLLVAFLLIGSRSVSGGRRDWLALVAFAAAIVAGGFFPETCADSLSPSCRRQELTFQLPASQYLHIVASFAEFGAITLALLLAMLRTRRQRTHIAGTYRVLAVGIAVCYPLLGVSYLVDRYGAVMEAAFFTGFTVLVVTELRERTGPRIIRSARSV